jgi:hypothetical protein
MHWLHYTQTSRVGRRLQKIIEDRFAYFQIIIAAALLLFMSPLRYPAESTWCPGAL